MSTLTATQLQQQYIAYFGRPGDPAGIKYWLSSSSGVSSAREFADKIYAQDEYKTSTVGTKSTEEQVNQIYLNLFGRTADADGLLYWTNQIEKGVLSLSNVAFDLIHAANNPLEENTAQGLLDATALSNKTAAAEAYTAELEASTEAILAYQPESTSPWKTGTAFTSAVSFITGITQTAHTADEAKSSVTSMTSASNAASGTSFTLTNDSNQVTGGADNFTGSTGNDTFLAVSDAAFDNGDVVNGGAGTDTLKTRFSLNGNKVVNGGVTNVENVSVDLDDGATGAAQTLTFSVDGFTGLSSLTAIDGSSTAGSLDTLAFTNIAAGVTLGLTNGDANVIYNYGFSDTSEGDDTATLNINKGKASNVIIAGVETVTIDNTGKSTLTELNVDLATKLVLTGSGKLTINDLDSGVNTVLKTVDASGSTGGVVLDGFIAGDVIVTGGSGDDKFNFTDNGFTATADSVVGGEGKDTLVTAASSTAVFKGTDDNPSSGLEVLEIKTADIGGAATITASGLTMASITEFVASSNTASNGDVATFAVTNMDSGDTISVTTGGADSTALTAGVSITGTLTDNGTADEVTLKLKGIGAVTDNASNDTGLAEITLDSHETINLQTDKNTAGTVSTNEIEKLSADELVTLTVTGASDFKATNADGIANTTKLTTLDSTGATGKFELLGLDKSDLTMKLGDGQNTIGMTALNNADTITAGTHAKDKLTATAVTGLTATTGKLNITDVETVQLQYTGANTIDASLLSGVKELSFSGANLDQTVTGLGAGVNIGIGDSAATVASDPTLKITLADSTGTEDALTFAVDNTFATTNNVAITMAGVETTTFKVSDDANNWAANLSKLESDKIIFTGGNAGAVANFAAGTDDLFASTATIDASDYKGSLLLDRTDGSVAGSITLVGDPTAAHTVQGSDSMDDVITIGSTTSYSGNLAHTVTGGNTSGSDTLNAYVTNGFASVGNVSEVEDINLHINPGQDVTITTVGGFNDGELNNINIKGGNELSTFKIGTNGIGAATTETIDASGFGGNIDLLILEAAIDNQDVVITGGAMTTDGISVDITNSSTIKFNTPGVEKIRFMEATGASTVDLTKATDATLVSYDSDQTMTFSNVAQSTVIQLGLDVTGDAQLGDASGVEAATSTLSYTSVGGASDAVTINLADTDNSTETATLDIDSIETITFAHVKGAGGGTAAYENHTISLAGSTNATNKIKIVHTGGAAAETITYATSGGVANITSVDASGSDSALDFGVLARLNTAAMTITGTDVNDTLGMEHGSDVIAAGGGTGDTLQVQKNAILGGFAVDLSSTGDQVTTFNGAANTTVQSGFENADLSNVTGTQGAEITAIKGGSTMTGTPNVDVINGGAGVDTIDGKGGGDTMTGGAGLDSFTNDTSNTGTSAISIGGTGNGGTITGYDVITDFALGTASTNSETLNVVGTAALVNSGGNATNGTDSTLTVAGIALTTHTIATDGEVVFAGLASNAVDTYAALAAAAQYLSSNDIGIIGTSVWMTGQLVGSNNTTWVYTQTAAIAGNLGGYDLVQLDGVKATSMITINADTASAIFIA